MIRDATPADAAALAGIYNHYIRDTTVTFEEAAVSEAEMASRIAEVRSAGLPWLVAEDEAGVVLGHAYASKWKGRCAYRFAVETTVYLDATAHGRGLGRQLYERLLAMLREAGMHVAIGGIALPNPASIALHEKLGFRKVGQFEEVGFKLGRWVDVGYWQVML
ncbi:arsinothricin resistance N-acetyltransferase ArsN1 family B [Novilysobacter erysipheiresistens]|uniref:Arsinothricin resistance N-acetyltransferase ArsN1 family B n=1 Tax=Novilysobacter erysipheiresistens TaxID=1749332 RepID=A0ABU7YVG0_9GAMM